MHRCLALVVLAAATWLPADAASADDATAPELSQRTTGQLIQQLGSREFATREAATGELSRRGESVEPQLRDALRHPDLEVRLRASRLLAGMFRADLRRRLAAFVNDVEGGQQHDLPAWNEFQRVFGSDVATRRLFAEMVTDESELLAAYASDKKKAGAMLGVRVKAFENGLVPGLNYQASVASVATMLFLVSDQQVPVSTSLGFQVYRFLNLSAGRRAVEDKQYSPLLKQLVTSWIERGASNSSLARSGLMLAERYEMNEVALSLAARILSDKEMPSYSVPYALLTIGRLGNARHLATIRPHLTNMKVCHTWHSSKFEKPIQIQVRDVTLAVLVHLTKQDHKQYGFDLLRPDGNGFFYVFTLGFANDEQRNAALARWDEWSRANRNG